VTPKIELSHVGSLIESHRNAQIVICKNVTVKFALEEAMNAQRGSRGIAQLFL
jgi:hypothetical protein